MNPNIKVINEKIWMVDFSQVGMNFIQELSFRETRESDFITLTKEGKYLLNSADEYGHKYIPYLKTISVFPNRLIGTQNGFCSFVKVLKPNLDKLTNKQINELLNQSKLNGVKEVFDLACKWEKTRRMIEKGVIENGKHCNTNQYC